LLLKEPDILLLDEPTNHLDAESVAWLEKHLQQYEGTVIAVTHDRYFLDNVAGWILELERGYGIPWKGNYSSWLEQKQQRLAQEAKTEAVRQQTLQRELEWLHMSPRARQAKAKARINQYYTLVAQTRERTNEEREIFIAPGPRLGDVVIRAEGITKGYGDHLLYDSLTFDVPAGAIVGIVGPNGAGKTTLFRMIVGEGLTLSLAGLGLGLMGAWWLGRAGSSLLFGVTATDPLTFMTVSLVLTAVALAACYVPARHAMKVEPIVALRQG